MSKTALLLLLCTGVAPAQTGKLRVIAIGAHPDDCDSKFGGTAVKFAAMGHAVKFLAVANGDGGHQSQGGGALAKRRRAEAQESARRLGIAEYEVLDNHDGEVLPTIKIRADIIRRIRQWNADIVLTHRSNDYHPDHRYTGMLVQDAAYIVVVPNVCPDTPPLRKNPVFLYFEDRFQKPNPFHPDIAVAIDDVYERKMDGIDAHVSQMYEWGPWVAGRLDDVPKTPEERRKWLGARRRSEMTPAIRAALEKWYGADKARSFQRAEAFELCEYGRQPSESEIRQLFPMLPASAAASSVPPEFQGRWDIAVHGQEQPRAWWLEVAGADTGKGRFVGAPGGQTDQIQDVAVRDGELRFTLSRRWHGYGAPATEGVFTAKLVNGRLEGVFSLDGEPRLKWTGKRAPVLTDRDDGSWREGSPVNLFNGQDLSGWVPDGNPTVFVPPAPVHPGMIKGITASGWSVKDGCLSTEGKATYLSTKDKFWNFLLHVRYRVGSRGNSGICLRGRYEVQVADDYGRSVNSHSSGGVYGFIMPATNASRPAGEWQTYDIWLVGRQVTIISNGAKVIDKGEIEGMTAVSTDPNEGEPGPIKLQGDHGAVDFKEIVVTPLIK